MSKTRQSGEPVLGKPSARRIRQISAISADNTINTQCAGAVVALCEDGSLWLLPLFQASPRGTRQEWERLPAIPTETVELTDE